MSRLFFVFAHARRAVSLAKSYALSFARAWRAGFFGAKVLLWADGKKRIRLMNLWYQRQLSAKFLRFFEKKRSLPDKVQNFDIPQPFSAEISRENGALPFIHLPFRLKIEWIEPFGWVGMLRFRHAEKRIKITRLQGRCDFGGLRDSGFH